MRNGYTVSEAESSEKNSALSALESPDFDTLARLAKDNPEAFEKIREQLCAQAIHSAPEVLQRRLKGLQFSIDMARKTSNNSYASCMKLSSMMQESFAELHQALSNPQEYLRQQDNANLVSAEIIPLFKKKHRQED